MSCEYTGDEYSKMTEGQVKACSKEVAVDRQMGEGREGGREERRKKKKGGREGRKETISDEDRPI